MRTIAVFSTWHPTGYKKYGKDFVKGFLQNWPTEVNLTIYAEDHEPETYNADNIEVLDQVATLPDLKSWQARHKDNDSAHGWNKDHTKKSFLWDASRFANKVFALWHFAKYTKADIMIWCDGDVRTHTSMPFNFLQDIAPKEDQLVTFLGRKTWPECGWMMFNRHHPNFDSFMDQWRWIYESDDIFNHVEYHDSFIFGELVQDFVQSGTAVNNLGGPDQGGHIFINTALGKYMDHLKGFRKEVGKSLAGDLTGQFNHHDNPWWQDVRQVTKAEIRAEKMKKPHEYDVEQQQKSGGLQKKWKD